MNIETAPMFQYERISQNNWTEQSEGNYYALLQIKRDYLLSSISFFKLSFFSFILITFQSLERSEKINRSSENEHR